MGGGAGWGLGGFLRGSPTTAPTTATTTTTNPPFTFPPHHSFPPFYTLQPNTQTLQRQLTLWGTLISTYHATHSLFTLSLSTAPSTPLFTNAHISRSLDPLSLRKILDWMSTPEGGCSAEWIPPSSSSTTTKKRITENENEKNIAWIWWKRPEIWAEEMYTWIEETGQRGSVLTIYELREGDAVSGQEWVGMDEGMLRRVLEGLVRKGRAQVFEGVGGDGGGVKFF
ncbi:ESCRT-II complex subunit-domain-containing protein [Delphinella strobiligena]|nr:ESCRT-II complex subunit-domain-containing protein [Delphinella strobiligena]